VQPTALTWRGSWSPTLNRATVDRRVGPVGEWAGRAGVQRPDGNQVQEQFQGTARDAASPGCPVDLVGDLSPAVDDEGRNAADEMVIALMVGLTVATQAGVHQTPTHPPLAGTSFNALD
jgi:hypothetical protein